MKRRLLVALALAIGLGAWVPVHATPRALPGWPLYDRYCLACHGTAGDGQGPASAYTRGQPQAFSRGDYRWRSTPLGQPPTDDDLRTAIRHGAPGTSMPAFDGIVTDAELDQLLAVVKAFSPATFATPGRPVVLTSPPPPRLERGAALWTRWCASCHGAGTAEDASTPAVRSRPLASGPLHRPRARDDRDARRLAAAMSIATGLAGTAMPGFAGTLAEADLWALADHVVSLAPRAARQDRSTLDGEHIAQDRKTPLLVGTWPGIGDAAEYALFGAPVPAQGTPPASLAPAQASLHAEQCARCHAKQFREWQPSIHGAAASPGLIAQLDFGLSSTAVASCQRCHSPLAEQRTDRELRAEGVQCAGCHVRSWERHGPPGISASLLALPGYPLSTLAIYERGDFCLPCHQLPPRDAVDGKPLLNTYKEWLEGPYMKRGIQCQHCHMPNREHAVRGIHDVMTLRQGIALTASAHRLGDAVTVNAELENIGAGHYLPTTPTPAIWLAISLVDARGKHIEGANAKLRIGRDVYFDGSWHDRADTRIPPGERAVMSRAWSGGRTTAAAAARISVDVHPDAFYEAFYELKLAGRLPPAQRVLYEQALTRARASHYRAETRDVPLAALDR